MNLFEYEFDSEKNWLPKDGTVNYYGKLFIGEVADNYFIKLSQNIEWKNDEIIIFGKHIVTKRKVAWYGEKEFKYTYSKITKLALGWTKELLEIKEAIENKTGESFNSCLLNLYHNGDENMSWHSDDEKDLKKNSAIASLSLGAERKFTFKHKESKEKVALVLGHGSLLLMKHETQSHWLHQLPKTKLIKSSRINLTFRTILEK